MFKLSTKVSLIIFILVIGVSVSLLASVAAGVDEVVETVKVSCECKTKANESACKVGAADWQIARYSLDAATNPDIEWDEDFTSSYCYRHKSDMCLCDDESLFSGSVD